MTPIDESDESCAIAVSPVRLVFRWTGDRWAHAIEVAGFTVASSEEWDTARGDPSRVVSPAYQQFSRQIDPHGIEQALLVGQWGPHHFSGVLQVMEEPSGARIMADVAVRTRAGVALDALTSTYRVHLNPGSLVAADPSTVVWSLDPAASGWLRFEPGEPNFGAVHRIGLAEAGPAEARVQAEAPIVPGARSHRLIYQWRWRSAASHPDGTGRDFR